jgi:hypothetical protein
VLLIDPLELVEVKDVALFLYLSSSVYTEKDKDFF